MKKNVLIIILLGLGSSILADEIMLNSKKISELLTSKSISGVHYGKKTAQYFSSMGTTLWISQSDLNPSEGLWKIKENQYCSKFSNTWSCYNISLDEKQNIYYFLSKGFRAPFVVNKNFNLSF